MQKGKYPRTELTKTRYALTRAKQRAALVLSEVAALEAKLAELTGDPTK